MNLQQVVLTSNYVRDVIDPTILLYTICSSIYILKDDGMYLLYFFILFCFASNSSNIYSSIWSLICFKTWGLKKKKNRSETLEHSRTYSVKIVPLKLLFNSCRNTRDDETGWVRYDGQWVLRIARRFLLASREQWCAFYTFLPDAKQSYRNCECY